MPIVLNKSAAMISATTYPVWTKVDSYGRSTIKKRGKHFDFPPSALVDISSEDLKELKTIPLIERSFENEVLVTGSKARKIAKEDEEVIDSGEETGNQE